MAQGEYEVFDNKQTLLGYIDRTDEDLGGTDDECVYCRLPCGFELRFWQTGLPDLEYIRRTKEVKD